MVPEKGLERVSEKCSVTVLPVVDYPPWPYTRLIVRACDCLTSRCGRWRNGFLFVPVLLVFRILCLLLIAAQSESRIAEPDVYTPVKTFHLGATASSSQARTQFPNFALGDTDLYAVRRTGMQLDLLQVSRLGSVVAARSLALPGHVAGTTLSRDGRLFVLINMPGSVLHLQQISISGDEPAIPLPTHARSITVTQAGVVVMYADGTLALVRRARVEPLPGVHVPPASAKLYDLTSLNAHTLAAIHRYSNEIRLFDLRNGSAKVISVEAPEVKESVQKIDTITAGAPKDAPFAPPVLFHAAASDEQGNLFLGVSPGPVRGGMRVVQLGSDGSYVRSLRLRPAASPGGQNSSDSPMRVQRYLSISGFTMATLSEDGTISLFTVKER
jgi:hypothetical protein